MIPPSTMSRLMMNHKTLTPPEPTRRRRALVGLTALLLALGGTLAPSAQAQAQPHHERQLRKHLIPPERLLEHAQQLELTQAQRERLKELMKASQSKMIDLRFALQTEAEALDKLVAEDKPDAKKVMAQAEKVLKLEGDLKRETLLMLVQVKQTLTPEQLTKVKEHLRLRRARQAPMSGPEHGPNHGPDRGPDRGPAQGPKRPGPR